MSLVSCPRYQSRTTLSAKGRGPDMASVRLGDKRRALVRGISDGFENALAQYFGTGPTDLPAARAQHDAYVKALQGAGVEVIELPADPAYPDCVFVEDQAVVIDGHVLLPTVGAPSRRGEQPPIAEILTEALQGRMICRMTGDARLDGGDVLRVRNRFFVGRSTRTNDAGIAELKELLDHLGHRLDVIPIPEHALHLTSISSAPTDSDLLIPEGYLEPQMFPDMEDIMVHVIPGPEVYGCNTIGFADGSVLMATDYPSVQATLEGIGLTPVPLTMDEIRAADGSLTCLSIFF